MLFCEAFVHFPPFYCTLLDICMIVFFYFYTVSYNLLGFFGVGLKEFAKTIILYISFNRILEMYSL